MSMTAKQEDIVAVIVVFLVLIVLFLVIGCSGSDPTSVVDARTTSIREPIVETKKTECELDFDRIDRNMEAMKKMMVAQHELIDEHLTQTEAVR